jgi:hypothetical protein
MGNKKLRNEVHSPPLFIAYEKMTPLHFGDKENMETYPSIII